MQQMGNFTQLMDVLRENWPILLVWLFVFSLVAGSLLGAIISLWLIWCGGRWHRYQERRRLARVLATAPVKIYPREAKEVNDWPWIDDEGNDLE